MKQIFIIFPLLNLVLGGHGAEQLRENNKKLYLVEREINNSCNQLENISDACNGGLINRFYLGEATGIGCYNESSIDSAFNGIAGLRNLSENLGFVDPLTSSVMDNGYCIKYCADYLFNYATIGYAAINGNLECKCGNAIQGFTPINGSFCNNTCTFPVSELSNNATYPCGGNNVYTVYDVNESSYKKPNITIQKKIEIMNSLTSNSTYVI
jgi:hypothetical protein